MKSKIITQKPDIHRIVERRFSGKIVVFKLSTIRFYPGKQAKKKYENRTEEFKKFPTKTVSVCELCSPIPDQKVTLEHLTIGFKGRAFVRFLLQFLVMEKRANLSAGLLLYRQTGSGPEVLLAHPGGPFWANREAGAWTIPKGLVEDGEEFLSAACREFEEETGIRPLGPFFPLESVRQKAGKVIHAWAWQGDADLRSLKSNLCRTEWPRGSGQWQCFPEVDRYGWFSLEAARAKLNPAQTAFIDRLEALLS
jgi:predicted NUDIX family NTP pyrophosphohydrolase